MFLCAYASTHKSWAIIPRPVSYQREKVNGKIFSTQWAKMKQDKGKKKSIVKNEMDDVVG